MRRAAFLLLGACTSLGPMPATTGIGAAPIGRTSVVGQVGVVPGFYASQSAQNDAKGQALKHGTMLFEPGKLVGIPGLFVGGGIFGDGDDVPLEPYVGYRRHVGGAALGAVAFASTKRADENGASYHGVRAGAEAMASGDVVEWSTWGRLRAQAAVSMTRVLASGRYCVDDKGIGIDCSQDVETNHFVNGKTVGVYPAGTATLALDLGHHRGLFDGAQLAVLATVGRMPLVRAGEESGTGTYASLGLTLTVALGLGRDPE